MRKNKTASRLIRLNKYLAEAGVASRRKADELIEEGKVTVNGKKVFELGTRVDPTSDRIIVSGKPVKAVEDKVYIMFNKPKNLLTTMDDPEGRPNVGQYFEGLPVRVFPVGRLDWDSEGLLLLTNDGEFANRVMHPKHEIAKTYMVKVSGKPTEEQLERLRRGVSIIGGRVAAKAVERVRRIEGEKSGKYDWIKIIITEGKNRQVRRMFEKIGYDVLKLQRVAVGRLRLGNIDKGEFVYLTPKGIDKIFQTEPLKPEIKTKKKADAPKRKRKTSAKRQPQKSKRLRLLS